MKCVMILNKLLGLPTVSQNTFFGDRHANTSNITGRSSHDFSSEYSNDSSSFKPKRNRKEARITVQKSKTKKLSKFKIDVISFKNHSFCYRKKIIS